MELELEISKRLDIDDDSSLVLVVDEETGLKHYEIVGFDRFKSQVAEVVNFLEDRQFIEEDRKSLATTRAAVNKFKDSINDNIKSAKSELFSVVDSQKKEAQSLLDNVTSVIKSKIDVFDQMMRLKKQEMFEEEINRRVEYQEELKGLDVFDIIDGAWLNRSSSDKKSLEQLNSRLDAVYKLVKSNLCKSDDPSEICNALQLYDWSELQTIEYFDAKYAPAEMIEETKDVSAESTASEDEIEEVQKEIISLEINSEDFARLIEILKVSNIDFKLV